MQSLRQYLSNYVQQVSLIHSDRRLTSPSQHQLQVSGQFTANLKYGPNETQETIFVAKSFRDRFWAVQELNH